MSGDQVASLADGQCLAGGTALCRYGANGVKHPRLGQGVRERNVTPRVARSTSRTGGSGIHLSTTRHGGYAMSQCKCIEQCFGWGKTIGPIRQVMVRARAKVDQRLTPTMTSYKLRWLRSLEGVRQQFA